MKKLLNYWTIAILYLIINLFVSAYILLFNYKKLIPKKEIKIQTRYEKDKYFWTFNMQEFDSLMESLRTTFEGMKGKEQQLIDWEATLKQEENEIFRIRKELKDTQDEISRTILEIKEEEQRNLKTLAATYAQMSSDAVVDIFKHMDDKLIVKIMMFMSPESSGAICQSMTQSIDSNGKNMTSRLAKLAETIRLTKINQNKK